MEDILFGLKISGIGMTVVFSALIIIAWIVSLLQHLDSPTPKHVSKTTGQIPLQVRKEKEQGEISQELVVVITAAIAVAIKKKIKIKHIKYHSSMPESTWAKQGTAGIIGSHSIKTDYGKY